MPRVPEPHQAAFKSEAPVLRKTLKLIRRGLMRPQADLATLREQLAHVQGRLSYWQTVLMEDEHRIRSPVHLWDAWNHLRTLANDNDREMRTGGLAP
jgi:hypothetical protein